MEDIEKLKIENEELKKTISVKSDLISISAHQLRTSLSALKWILKMFTDGDLGDITPAQKGFIEKGLESNERMISLVNTLLTLNHSDTQAVEVHCTPTDIQKLLENTLLEFSSAAEKTGITLSPLTYNNTLPLVECDKDMIRVVLSGLIENALKYSGTSGTVSVSVKENTTTHMVEISIHNTGIGISKEEQAHIFTKFFRAKDAKEKNIAGSGLGLFIAKNIIDRHLGKIWFQSEPDSGTTFFIALPIA